MDWTEWIGRTETRSDIVTAAPMAALSATLDRNDPPPRPGEALPLLWHWLYFLPRQRASDLDLDGHARRGGFLPPVPLPRRMYAGGKVELHQPIRVGDDIERVSRIAEIGEKAGRSGPLVFVKVRHDISTRDGLALVEEHDIVYRDHPRSVAPAALQTTDRTRPTADVPVSRPRGREHESASVAEVAEVHDQAETVSDPAWERTVYPDDVLLFRYSALTFNSYRIHYDRRFAIEAHGYPGLVVHAPLIATCLADLLRRNLPQAEVAALSFRAMRPLFDGAPFSVQGQTQPETNAIKLWACGADQQVAMEALAVLR